MPLLRAILVLGIACPMIASEAIISATVSADAGEDAAVQAWADDRARALALRLGIPSLGPGATAATALAPHLIRQPVDATGAAMRISLPLSVLHPESAVDAIMAGPAGERRERLAAWALSRIGGDIYQREVAALAAALASQQPEAGPAEFILLARCQSEAGRHADALRTLDTLESHKDLLNRATEEEFDALDRLRLRILTVYGGAEVIARQLRALADTSRNRSPLGATVSAIPGGYEVRFRLDGPPRRLIALWIDREDMGPIRFAGTERPINGSWTAVFRWPGVPPPGSILVLAVRPEAAGAKLVADLPTVPVDRPTDPGNLDRWRRLLRTLEEDPPSTALVIRLPP